MFEKYVDALREQGPTPDILKQIINDHAVTKSKMIANYERYKSTLTGVPILTRKFPVEQTTKINNKLANDWFSEIIDTKTGYMFGAPVIIQLEKQAQNYDSVLEAIEKFRKRNSMDDLNGELCKFSAMCGYDAALLYIDRDGQERVTRIDPWEAVIISNGEITEPEFGFRYYVTHDDKCKVEFYGPDKVYTFLGDSFDNLAKIEEKNNMFDYCPLFGIPNNAELQGDADKVLTLIDAYDRSMSDFNSEIEQFRLAYMLFIGYAPDENEIQSMIQTGALYIPSAQDGEDIKFLVKNIDAAALDSHLDRLEANITRFAKHVNFTDEAFGGNLSGVAMRYKLFALETKSKITERKHEAAMLYMFKVLASAWKKKSINLDYTQIDLKYTRNIPVNILDEGNAAKALLGIVSKRTLLEQLSFVNDVEAEMERIAEEQKTTVNLDDPNLVNDIKKAMSNNGFNEGA